MNIEEHSIDQFTKRLMEGTMEKPSPSLVDSVMMRVKTEELQKEPLWHIATNSVVRWVVSVLLIYSLLHVGVVCLFYFFENEASDRMHRVMPFLPYLVMAFGMGFILFLYIQLDHWLHWKRETNHTITEKI